MIHGDCRDVLPKVGPVDAVVTDPPYGLTFMGQSWDHGVPGKEFWKLILKAMNPGAHLLAFGGTRTYHRLACAIEDAGFEIRDCIMWVYGCLSDDTEILVDGQWEPYHRAIAGRRALCYDIEHDTYSWQPIEDLFVYDYADTAYRVVSDSTDQIVSRGHRCIVERGGEYVFEIAEEAARQQEARVPVLEGLSDLLRDLPVPDEGAGGAESVLCDGVHPEEVAPPQAAGGSEGQVDIMRRVQQRGLEAECLAQEGEGPDVFLSVQREVARRGVGQARAQGTPSVDGGSGSVGTAEDDRAEQPSLEGWSDILPELRQLQADQVRPLSVGVQGDGSQGRIRDGAPADSGSGDGPLSGTCGDSPPRQPRPAGQPAGEPDAVRQPSGSQAVRGARYTRADLARIEPFHYVGKVWCVKVPTGAFVARRNGKVFVTGNSGFPKSLDVGKAMSKVGEIDAAQQWDGWGTALKPSYEPILVARKPLKGRVIDNVLKYGTGGLNIDACRVGTTKDVPASMPKDRSGTGILGKFGTHDGGPGQDPNVGRWPGNLAHDGSEEVLAAFPVAPGQQGDLKATGRDRPGHGRLGKMGPPKPHVKRGDAGSAARFFKMCEFDAVEQSERSRLMYCAKASRKERGEGNTHSTVKPMALMRWLIRLVTPPDGLVLDPFAGSGTTLLAARAEGMRSMGIEAEESYCGITVARLKAQEQEET